jgi:hypothetical protein
MYKSQAGRQHFISNRAKKLYSDSGLYLAITFNIICEIPAELFHVLVDYLSQLKH